MPITDDPRQHSRLQGSFEFEYGSLGDGTLWIRPRSGSLLRLDDRSLKVIAELQNGRSAAEVCARHHLPVGEVESLVNQLHRAGAVRPDRHGKIVRAKAPVDVKSGLWVLLALVMGAAQIDYFAGVARTTLLASPKEGIAVAAVALAAVFVHEGGHYLAARRFFRPRFGLTWLGWFPAAYVDTHQAWRLGRNARVQINAAGCFADLALNTAVVIAVMLEPGLEYYATPFLITQYTRWAITLNPFFSGDGYWLLADLTGIVNLRKTAQRHLRGMQRTLLSGYAAISMALGLISLAGLALLGWNIFGSFVERVLIGAPIVGPPAVQSTPAEPRARPAGLDALDGLLAELGRLQGAAEREEAQLTERPVPSRVAAYYALLGLASQGRELAATGGDGLDLPPGYRVFEVADGRARVALGTEWGDASTDRRALGQAVLLLRSGPGWRRAHRGTAVVGR